MHVAIAGNIGAGKTTLTKLLAKHYKWKPHFESVDENPYLDDFYGEMERWSFNLQVYFLNSRFRQILDRDFGNYSSLFELMENLVTPPDLLIYLRADISTLVGQIHKRGREYENSISIDYLSRLNERYEAWISTYTKGKLLVIDVDNLDFVKNQEDLGYIIDRIDSQINGLF